MESTGAAAHILRGLLSTVGLGLTVIGLGGLQDDVAQWSEWIGRIPFIDARWSWVLIGIGVIGVANLMPIAWRRRRNDHEIEMVRCAKRIVVISGIIKRATLLLNNIGTLSCDAQELKHVVEIWRASESERLRHVEPSLLKFLPKRFGEYESEYRIAGVIQDMCRSLEVEKAVIEVRLSAHKRRVKKPILCIPDSPPESPAA
jgi:hypothetical protein